MGLGIHKYQDQIEELSSQVTQPIKDAFGVLGLHLGEAKDKILVFLDDLIEKVMINFNYGNSDSFESTDDQDTGDSTSEASTHSILDRIKDLVPDFGNTEPESGE